MRDSSGHRLRPRHDFKAWIKVHPGRGELLEDADIALDVCGAVRNLVFQGFRAHHRLTKVRPIDGECQVRLLGLEARDVGDGRIFKFEGSCTKANCLMGARSCAAHLAV